VGPLPGTDQQIDRVSTNQLLDASPSAPTVAAIILGEQHERDHAIGLGPSATRRLRSRTKHLNLSRACRPNAA
jgi:hypothetical protein